MNKEEVYNFWFQQLEPKQWFQKSDEFDRQVASQFGKALESASLGEMFDWRDSPTGRLSEIILLDQFSRNIYRDQPQAFSQDPLALVLSQELATHSAFSDFSMDEKGFALMPMMHSESLKVHNQAVELYTKYEMKGYLDFEIKHKVIIERFGRYPHRNEILGRKSTPDELEFLKQPGSSF